MDRDLFESVASPLAVSCKVAVMATLLALMLGGHLAWRLMNRRGPLPALIGCLVNLPLIVPPTVLGFYLLALLNRSSLAGRFLSGTLRCDIIFTPAAAVLAATLAATPIMFRCIKAGVESVSPDIIGAARLDGASEFDIFLRIRMPLALKSVVSGVMLSFMRALGEFGATLMVAGNIPGRTQTLSLAIWGSVMSGHVGHAHLLAGILLLTCLAIVGAVQLLDGRADPALA